MGGECGDDLVERRLDIGERFHTGEARAKDIGTTDNAGGVLAAFVIALVEVTEFLAAQGGRATRDAIFFEMVTSAKGHGTSKYDRPTA